jgi:type I restriction enzyme S subunit
MRDGWVETTLDAIAEVVMGQSPDGKTYNQDGKGLPFMQGSAEFGEHNPAPEKWCSDPKKVAEPGDLLLSVRAPVGDTNFADQRIAVGRGLSIIRANKESRTAFIRLVIQFNVTELIASSGSGMFASITGKNLKEFKVNLPPLPEQRRIVDLISSVDSYIEGLQRQLESAKGSRNAVLHELLTAGGDGWVETTLGEVAEVIGGGTPSTTIGEYWDGDIVWLTPTEITSQDGKVVSDSIRKITDLGFKNSGAQMLPMDSVILTSRASVGFVALAGKELCTNQGFQSLIPKPTVLSKFLMFWIQQNRSEFESRSAGSTFKEISKSNVKSIKLLLPPLPEQKRIVDMVNTIDEVISQTELTTSKVQNLRAGLLSDLLSGDHAIPNSYDKVMGAA